MRETWNGRSLKGSSLAKLVSSIWTKTEQYPTGWKVRFGFFPNLEVCLTWTKTEPNPEIKSSVRVWFSSAELEPFKLRPFQVSRIIIRISCELFELQKQSFILDEECIKKIKCMFNNKRSFFFLLQRPNGKFCVEMSWKLFWIGFWRAAESRRALDSIGGGHLLRSLDSIGGANLLRGLDSIGGAHLLRQVDSIGGGNLLRSVDHVPRYHKRGYDPLRYPLKLTSICGKPVVHEH